MSVSSDLVTAIWELEYIVRGDFNFKQLTGNFESPALSV